MSQFNFPMAGLTATASGTCALFAGTPCHQVTSVDSDGLTNSQGKTTITVRRASGVCGDLNVEVAGYWIHTLSHNSYDFTGDGAVNLADLGALADTFNKAPGAPGYNDALDFTCDDIVNLSDLGLFASHFSHSCP